MIKNNKQLKMSVLLMLFGSVFLFIKSLYAHRGTLNGAVVETARKALEVRKRGDQARYLADMYFFETLVRIHRAGEGAPYSGLKPGSDFDPAVVLADKALEKGPC